MDLTLLSLMLKFSDMALIVSAYQYLLTKTILYSFFKDDRKSFIVFIIYIESNFVSMLQPDGMQFSSSYNIRLKSPPPRF